MKSQLVLLKRSFKNNEKNNFVDHLSTTIVAPETILCQPVVSTPSGRDTVASAAGGGRDIIIWSCGICCVECLPVTRESRCLCGHRLKEHDIGNSHNCTSAKCKCRRFNYIVAEGAWMLRCRCKHKAVEHDCTSPTYKCSKCTCLKFDSPWVCNCGCLWSNHSSSVIDSSVTHRKIGSNIVRKDGGNL